MSANQRRSPRRVHAGEAAGRQVRRFRNIFTIRNSRSTFHRRIEFAPEWITRQRMNSAHSAEFLDSFSDSWLSPLITRRCRFAFSKVRIRRYRIIEANIQELLADPGERASWC
jgi:hypothetical protein